MTPGEFSAGDWIDRLAGALPALAKAQEPYLPGDRRIRAFLPAIPGVEDAGFASQAGTRIRPSQS